MFNENEIVMSFLVWEPPVVTDIQPVTDSLEAVNDIYGCPYLDANGYRMDIWDIVLTSSVGDAYGFYKPEPRLGKDVVDLMAVMFAGYIEHEEIPTEFIPEEETETEGSSGKERTPSVFEL